MATDHPLVNELVCYLADSRDSWLAAPGGPHRLEFSSRHMSAVRDAFAEMIRSGEAKLHRLCELFEAGLFERPAELTSVVIGEVRSGKRFTLIQPLSPFALYGQTDLDLGNRMLSEMRFASGDQWEQPRLVANFVEYQPRTANQYGIHKLISRIKAEEEIWNKVVDEIFELDVLVSRDKELARLGRYVKDIFGLKLVVDTEEQVRHLQERLQTLTWDEEQLGLSGIAFTDETRQLQWVETKDYLGTERAKESGWQALKSVVTWWGRSFEIQIVELGTYVREREFLTRESHEAFKARREAVRDQVAVRLPLFGFYRDLLRWLFTGAEGPAPLMRGIEVVVRP